MVGPSRVTVREPVQDRVFVIANRIFLLLVTALVLFPLLFVVASSFSDPTYVNSGRVLVWPRGFTVESFELVFERQEVWRGYVNTVYYVAVDIVVSLAVILSASYALSRPDRLRFSGGFTFFFTFTMLFSGGLIPTYLVIKSLGFVNTVWALVLPNAAGVWLIIVTRTFFKTSLPKDLYDAAEIDGASFTQCFFRLVLPLSTAIIAVVALFKGVQQWNSFLMPLIYLTDYERYPLSLILRNILLENQQIAMSSSDIVDNPAALAEAARRGELAESMKYSLIIVSSLPVLVIYPFLQKYLTKGVMIGSLKG